MFREKDGKISFTRISGALIIIVNLIAGAHAVIVSSVPQIPDIPLNWALLVGALYGLNVANIYAAIKK